MADVGYTAIFRQIFNHWLWQEKPFSKGQAWIDLILLANHSDHKKPKGDKIITYRRGDVNRSILFLADRWGWDRKTVKRFLRVLEADNMVTVRGTTQGTTITIVNYDFWQGKGSTKGTMYGTAYGATHGTTYGTQTIMNNNDEEGEEGGGYTSPTAPPSLDEIKAECRLQRYDAVDPEKFFSYYEARRWKLGGEFIDWRAMLRKWDLEDRDKTPKKEHIDSNDIRDIVANVMKRREAERDDRRGNGTGN